MKYFMFVVAVIHFLPSYVFAEEQGVEPAVANNKAVKANPPANTNVEQASKKNVTESEVVNTVIKDESVKLAQETKKEPDQKAIDNAPSIESVVTEATKNEGIKKSEGENKAEAVGRDMGMKTSKMKESGMNKRSSKLRDPTRISDSFRSALRRMAPKAADAAASATPIVKVIPDIELAGIVDGYGKDRTALLRLGDKVQMVRKGRSFTTIQGSVVYEIFVEDIDLCEIKLNVSPPNQLLILR